MTKKEKMHYECIKVRNEIATLSGWLETKVDLESYVNTGSFMVYAKKHTTDELERELDYAKHTLKEYQLRAAREAFFETEEGQQYKKEREDRIEDIRKLAHKIYDNSRATVSKIVKDLLGEQWDVTHFSDSSMEIAIIEKHLEDGRPKGLFGHEFTISFDRAWSGSGYRWEMNYPTMGSFNLSENNSTRVQLLVGMAKFANDTEFVPWLRDYLHKMVAHLGELKNELWQLEDELKNPQISKQ